MKLSFRALKQWIDFSGSAQDLAAILADLGFPNDGMIQIGEGLDQVVVAKVLTKKKHPQADRLNLLTVSIGTEELPIVCGAQNMSEGDYVALAPVGVTVPGKDGDGLFIKEAKIRGEISKGMCCSEVELRLADESEGIWLLSKNKVSDLDLGKKVGEIFDLQDFVIDVDITPNRPDAMSVRGLAREVAAKLGLKLKTLPSLKWKSGGASPKIESFSDTYGFAACLVQGVSVKESPADLRRFLSVCGARSISNLVDITNQILFELGHPIHFFDADKIDLPTLQSRRAKEGESLTLLNGKIIQLTTDDLVIADHNGPLSLAGIMGGSASSVTDATKNIVVEVACFNPGLIRASSKRHQIFSESSMRFERGLTAFKLDEVVERTLGILKELSGFDYAAGGKSIDAKLKLKEVLWDRARVERKLGKISLTDNDIFEILRRLEYEFSPKGSTVLVEFPWYRTDVHFLEDIMEDIGRLLGYENLEKKALGFEISVDVLAGTRGFENLEKKIADSLTRFGFSEVLNLNFSSAAFEKDFGYPDAQSVEIANPLQADRNILRGRLVPELVRKARDNYSHGEEDIRLFEMTTAFRTQGQSSYLDSPVIEERRLALVWLPRAVDKKNLWRRQSDLYFEMKGIVDALFESYRNLSNFDLTSDMPLLHPKRQQRSSVGFFGELHPRTLKKLDVVGQCFVGEWTLNLQPRTLRYATPFQFPSIDMDASFLISKSVPASELLTVFQKEKVPFLEDIKIYDVFESADLGSDKKSLTFSMRYRSPERTLLLEEAKESHDKLVSSALKKFASSQIALR